MVRSTLRHAVVMLFAVLLLSAFAPSSLEFPERLARFHEHYDRFLRSYLGCPKGATAVDQCRPELGTLDYLEFNRAARQGRELFGLKEEPGSK